MIDYAGYCACCHRNALDCKGGVWRRIGPSNAGICRNCWFEAGRSFGELPSGDAIDLASRERAR